MKLIFLIAIITIYFLTYCLMAVASKADDDAEAYMRELKLKEMSDKHESEGKD